MQHTRSPTKATAWYTSAGRQVNAAQNRSTAVSSQMFSWAPAWQSVMSMA